MDKQFTRKLSGVIRSAKNQRETIQELIVFGLVHYDEHDDSMYLTEIVRKIKGVRSLPTNTIAEYIKAHSGLAWGKLKDKQPGFKTVKGEKNVVMPEVPWYDWEGGKHNEVKADYQFRASIQRAITNAVKASQEGRLSTEDREALRQELDFRGVPYTEDKGRFELVTEE